MASICVFTLTSIALSETKTCYSVRDEAKQSRVKCEVKFLNGSIVSIRDMSGGYTFRIGENGWISASKKKLHSQY
jgi:hypothetical protein